MPDFGFINSSNATVNPNQCSPNALPQTLNSILGNILNLQNQLGDVSTFQGGLPGDGGIGGNSGVSSVANSMNSLLSQFSSFLQTASSGGYDTYKVKVNSSDTPDFLEDQWRDGHTQAGAQYNATQDLLVEFDTVDVSGNKKVRAYIDSSDISTWSSSGQILFGWDTSAPTNTPAGMTKWDSGDTLAYLKDQFNDAAAFDSSADALIKYDTATAHLAKLFLDSSAISGYSGSGKLALIVDGGALKWKALKTETVVTDSSFDEDTCIETVTTDSILIFED